MYKNGDVCPICGAGNLEKKVVEEVFEYKGNKIKIPDYIIYDCAACRESIVDNKSSKRASKILKDFNREVDGLLTSSEIKRIRMKLDRTQEEMSIILGGGLKGFARYETGQVIQSKAMDNLLRILDKYPFVVDAIEKKEVKVKAAKVATVVSLAERKQKYSESVKSPYKTSETYAFTSNKCEMG